MNEYPTYYQRITSAMVRGKLSSEYPGHELFSKFLEDLTEDQNQQLLQLGTEHNIKLHTFQRQEASPETKKILDVIRGISPDNVLDIGSGRGSFIWRLLDEYRNMPITAIDTSEERIQSIKSIYTGGITNLKAKQANTTDLSMYPNDSFDVSTVLKVLEYIEDVEKAVAEICRVTKRFIIVQFPAHPDNNQDKKHFFAPDQLTALFKAHDLMQVKVELMSNYNILVARK